MNRSSLAFFWAKLGKETWPAKVRGWVRDKLGLQDESAAGVWLAFWAAAHDIAKVSPCFQSQGKTEELRLQLGESWFESLGSKPHGDIST